MKNSHLSNFLGGATSGFLSTLILQPLDVVKTRLQLSPHTLSLTSPLTPSPTSTPGILSTVRLILLHDSPRGLWRGITPTVIRNTLGVGLYFTTLNSLTARLTRADGTTSDTSTLLAGASARSLAVCVLCPLSVVKTRLELAEYSAHYAGVSDALRKIARSQGPAGLFSGLIPTIVRDAPYSALFVLIYLRSKEAMAEALGMRELADGDRKNSKAMSMGVNFAAGAFGGGLATILTSPQDMVKTRMQVMHGGLEGTGRVRTRGIRETIRAVYAEAGVSGFFRGASPRFLKRMLGSAVTWMVFEETVSLYERALQNTNSERG